MPLIIFIAIIVIAVVWWARSERHLSLNERSYLRRRGYEVEQAGESGPPIAKDTRLFNILESLNDLSPFARQRAADDLSRMCLAGQRDARMLSPLVAALEDSDPAVRGAVAAALGNLGDVAAVEPLKNRLELDESIHVRAAARKAIERLEGGGEGEKG
jgi:hypothetical protein